jgi:ketosteroid isomerase-like protein
MSDEDESVVRAAYEAYGQGEVNRLLELVHPDLEWTYLDPSMENPQPQTCHGRERDEARGFAGLGQGKR